MFYNASASDGRQEEEPSPVVALFLAQCDGGIALDMNNGDDA